MIVRWLAYVILLIVPADQRDWAEAMHGEIRAIHGVWQRLTFALHCLLAALHLRKAYQDAADGDALVTRSARPLRIRLLPGVACAGLATIIGLVYLYMAGAPPILMFSNVAAFVVGLLLLAGLYNSGGTLLLRYTILTVASAMTILLTAAFGRPIEGAARWIAVGGVFMQTSLVLMPMAVVAFSRATNILSATAMSMIAIGLAWQPDRAMAGALSLALLAVAFRKGGAATMVPALISAVALVVTLARPDMLPAVPYVDWILWSAFRIHWLLGTAMWAGCATLLFPALYGKAADKAAGFGFLALWAAIVAAAVIGAYPTPFVGYGAAAIIGYLLSLFALCPPTQPERHGVEAAGIRDIPFDPGTSLRMAPEPG